MKNPQCVHCMADIDIESGKCGRRCLCEHFYPENATFYPEGTFTCKECGMTVDVKMWRAKNFEKYLQCQTIIYKSI